MSRARQPVMIMAGGTGGHVYPALAVALYLMSKEIPVVWMGTRKGLEARVVPQHGIPMVWLSVRGLRGKGWRTWLQAPFVLMFALLQALVLLLRYKPRVALGMGGFVAGPGGLIAGLLRKPLVIHEQNAVVGLTNRILRPLSTVVLEGFPGTFGDEQRATHVGNPVRREISALPRPDTRLDLARPRLRLLVVGGSLGAAVFNSVVPQAIRILPAPTRPEIWQQAGPAHIDEAGRRYRQAQVDARLEPFIEDMAAAYSWADLVVCRAGALTIAEIAAVGLAAVLVPYPHAVDDHQTANAQYLVNAGAAVLLAQPRFTATRLAELLQSFNNDRAQLQKMASSARTLAVSGAAERVGDICLRAACKHGDVQSLADGSGS